MNNNNNNNNNNILNIKQTFGVGSSRYISCIPFNFKTQMIQESILNRNSGSDSKVESEYLLTVPIGGGIVHWNIKTKKRITESPNQFKQLHSDVITCLIRSNPIKFNNEIQKKQEWFNKYFHISSSYCGEIGIWDNDWNLISLFQLPLFDDGTTTTTTTSTDSNNHNDDNEIPHNNKIMHISLDESYESFPIVRLAVSNEHGNCNITILKLDFSNYLIGSDNSSGGGDDDDDDGLIISIENEFKNELYFFGEMVDSNHFIVVQQDVGKQGFQQSRTKIIGENKINILKINCKTSEIVNQIKDSIGPQECTILIKNQNYYNNNNKEIIISRGRTLSIINTNTVEIIKTIKCEGSGLMKDILFYDNFILVPCSNSDLLLYNSIDTKLLSKYKSGNSHGEVYSLKWSIPGKRLWLFDESGIHSIYLKDELSSNDKGLQKLESIEDVENYKLLYHQITCCGIDFNKNGDKVACGDFLGNIMIWDCLNDDEIHHPIKEYCFGIPIRSVSWGDNIGVLIGLMDGSLMFWDLNNNNSSGGEPILIESLNDGITCIQWEKKNDSSGDDLSIFAVGTTGGNLYVFEKNTTTTTGGSDSDKIFNLKWKHLAHQPIDGPQDLKFGSINKFAEIWSLTFHPKNNELIATCSEDQTTIIWNRVTGEKIKTLTGHTTAVTCVDWLIMPSNDDSTTTTTILATCADDQTIRIWNTDIWKEVLIVNTNDIGEWHTVTYISLIVPPHSSSSPSSSSSPLIVCATQNGWIFVWDIKNGSKVYSKRVHLGSIEGLRWNKVTNRVISCSSDCLIHVYDVNNNK